MNHAQKIYYRASLRKARYLALANSENFNEICYTLETLGKQLTKKERGLNHYKKELLAIASENFPSSPLLYEDQYRRFNALFERLRTARNDVMHSGVFARNATHAAIELCIYMEDGLMANQEKSALDVMVNNPTQAEGWHLLWEIRKIMLTNSFSCLPIYINDAWHFLTDFNLAKFISKQKENKFLTLESAFKSNPAMLICTEKTYLINTSTLINDIHIVTGKQ